MPSKSQGDDSTKVVLIVVGSVVGVCFLLALACGGIFFLTTYVFVKTAEKTIDKFSEEVEKSRHGLEASSAAEAFLMDLSINQLPRAYQNTTRDYQGRHTQENFRAYVDEHPLLKKNGNFRQVQMPIPPVVDDRVTVRFTLNGNQATTVTLDMLKENGRWKVDEVVAP
ncbi:MAG TPA: hypothetical protein VKA46_43425 [Gemmataceae bacterium]|nr:hypothetical protein [Gemmataceae bacterium]